MNVVTREQMLQIEQAAQQYDLSPQRLMENAGSAAAAFIRRTFQMQGLNCMIFCGRGNNGGDGFVVARKLIENGANVLVVLVGGKPKSAEAQTMYSTIELMGLPVLTLEDNSPKVMGILQKADIVVDAIYGTGFQGALDPWVRKACRAINNAIAAVVALDLPSGVECDSALADEDAVNADFTVVFDTMKPAHVLEPGKPFCGKIEVLDIGIPDEARQTVLGIQGAISIDSVLQALPERAPDSHKGDYGKLLILAGSSMYRGAASLAALAALRCGTGLVQLASTETVCAAAAAKLHECVYFPLPENTVGGIFAEPSAPALLGSITKATAILFGCGMGNTPDTAALLKYVLQNAECPCIIDADGINALAANIDILSDTKATVILTPHLGEMARLCGKSVEEIAQDREKIATEFAFEHKLILVLKGPQTIIASQTGLLTNSTGNPGLAKAGSGDVLAGMIAAFTAQRLDPVMAAACGVHLHGLAADIAAIQLSQYAMLPSDLPSYVAQILATHNR